MAEALRLNHRLRPAISRTGLKQLDLIVALILAAITVAQVWIITSVHDRVAATITALVLCGAVAARRRWPVGALVAGVSAVALEAALGGTLVDKAATALPAGVLLFYGAGAFAPWRRALTALLIGIVGLLVQVSQTSDTGGNLFFEPVVIALVPWGGGWVVQDRARRLQAWRNLSERLDAAREGQARTAAELESIRIARELHDVIGHHLSVIALQVGGARLLLDTQATRAEAALHVVEQTAHEALGETTRLIGVLRSEPGADVLPAPGIADITELVERTRAAGLVVSYESTGEPRLVPAGLALCAYRILQEALTNVIKHAGPARVVVRVGWTDDVLSLDVADDGQGSATGGPAGHGLAGMGERAELYGGVVRAGARPDGGFRVCAQLPLRADILA